MRACRFDVLAIGAGPAGATASHLLARWGYRVALVDRTRDRTQARGLAESLPPSATKLFQRFDLSDVLRGRHVLPATGNTSWWGASACRSESFPHAGHQIHRPAFDRALVARARRSGALVRHGTAIKSVRQHEDHVEIEWRGHDGRSGRWTAQFVLDCSGRAGVIARRGLRRDSLYRTQALVGVWRHDRGFPLPATADQTHTLVESYGDGWAWSVPLSPRVRSVALMTSEKKTAYQRELARAPQHEALLRHATLVGRPWTTDASVYHASRYADGRALLVGDAASFIDPLSSFGVKKAMMSAWRAAVVVNTAIQDGARCGDALAYFERAEREMFAQSLDRSGEFFQTAALAHDSTFWRTREDAVDVLGTDDRLDSDEGFRTDPEVVCALRSLQQAQTLRLEPRSDVRFERIVEADGRTLVSRRALATAALKDPIRYVAGVELPRLFTMASSYSQVPDLYEAYNRAAAPVALHDFLGALSVLIAKGALIQQVDA